MNIIITGCTTRITPTITFGTMTRRSTIVAGPTRRITTAIATSADYLPRSKRSTGPGVITMGTTIATIGTTGITSTETSRFLSAAKAALILRTTYSAAEAAPFQSSSVPEPFKTRPYHSLSKLRPGESYWKTRFKSECFTHLPGDGPGCHRAARRELDRWSLVLPRGGQIPQRPFRLLLSLRSQLHP